MPTRRLTQEELLERKATEEEQRAANRRHDRKTFMRKLPRQLLWAALGVCVVFAMSHLVHL